MVGPSLDTSKLTTSSIKSSGTIKFLCSYGGKILPRYTDGKLRYHGGETRVLAVHCSISFAELLMKLAELCGTKVSLRCQLPTEDLDALVSITSDEDLSNLIEEYERVTAAASTSPRPPSYSLKIRAFLSFPKSLSSKKLVSSSPSSSSSNSTSPKYSSNGSTSNNSTTRVSNMPATAQWCHRQISAAPMAYPLCLDQSSTGKFAAPHHQHGYCAHHSVNPNHIYPIHNGNYWQ